MIEKAITAVSGGRNLTYSEATDAMKEIVNGTATPAQIGAYVTALHMKGETIDELAASAEVMRSESKAFNGKGDILDIVGIGGDEINTFNISTAAMFVVAASGITVAKHVSRSSAKTTNSGDVLVKLGINLNVPAAVSEELLANDGLCFLYANEYHKAFGGNQLTTGQAVCAPLQEDTEMTVDGVKIQILYAPINGNLAGGTTGNEFSNVIKISYGTHSFLFTGDLTAEHEQRLVQQGKDLHSTVLKVGHHGSNTSSSEAFLQMVNPSWCVISVGYGNSFGHPHKEIEKRLKQYTSQYIYRTDRDGAVVFRTDGKRMRMETAGDH